MHYLYKVKVIYHRNVTREEKMCMFRFTCVYTQRERLVEHIEVK